MRLALVIALACAAAPAAAGALPHCDPAPTAASEVARAKLVVVAKATARTRHLGHDELRTELVVVKVVHGDLKARTITVDDCDDWKCGILDVPRGKVVLLFLHPGEHKGHFELQGPRCQNGFDGTWMAYDEKDPNVAAVLAAASP